MSTLIEDFANATSLESIGTSSVWDVHHADLGNLGYKKGTNLNNDLKALKKQGHSGIVTVFVGAKGRSQHSKTALGIYKGLTNSDATCMYYTDQVQEFILERV